MGDIALNYRFQFAGLEGGPVAAVVRASLLLPTGDDSRGFGAGAMGFQFNAPLSLLLGSHVAAHANAGLTVTPGAQGPAGASASTVSYNGGGSLIWLPIGWLNFLVEAVWTSTATVTGGSSTRREDAVLLNPGVRLALNLPGSLQIVPGLAWTIGVGPSSGDRSVFVYLSVEHPFKHVAH